MAGGKVLILTQTMDKMGGDIIRINKIFSEFKKHHEVILVDFDFLFRRFQLRQRIVNFMKDLSSKKKNYYFDEVFLNFISDSFQKFVRKEKPSLIICEKTLAGLVPVKTEIDIPVILDVHGISSHELLNSGYIDKNEFEFIKEKEISAYNRADYISVVSNPMKEYFKKIGFEKRRIIVARNGGEIREEIAEYKIPLNLIYSGNFAYWERVEDYIAMKKHLREDRFSMKVLGGFTKKNKQRFLQDIKERGISYGGEVTREKSFEIISKCQIGVAPSSNDLVREVACPIKVWDYLSVGLPVITPRVGEWAEIIKREGCGAVTRESDAQLFSRAAEKMSEERMWRKMSKKASILIQRKMNWNTTLNPLIKKANEFL